MREQAIQENEDERLRRLILHRLMSRIASFFAVSRGLSSALFVGLIVLTDHAVAAADAYVSHRLEGTYDPLVIGLVEGLVMVVAGTLCLALAFSKGFVPPVQEWLPRTTPSHCAFVGILLGVEGVLWGISTKEVSAPFAMGSVIVGAPIILLVRGVTINYHFFHISGAVYACVGLHAATFAGDASLGHLHKSDVYHVLSCVMWALFLLGSGEFFGRHKRIPVLGVLLPWLLARLVVITIAVLFFVGFGNIHAGTFSCLLAGAGCGAAVPFALLGHSLVLGIRIASYVVVTKYVGAELCAITGVTSSALLFYNRGDGFTSTEVVGAVISCAGCAIFTHGQWMYELEKNQQWEEAVRLSAAPTVLSSTEGGSTPSTEEDDDDR